MATGKEQFLKFLKAIKVDTSKLKPILDSLAEETPDVDIDTIATNYLEARKDSISAELQDDFDTQIEQRLAEQKDAQFKEIAVPLMQKLIKSGGLTLGKNVKDLKVAEVLAAYEAKMAEAGTHTDTALKKKYDDLALEYNTMTEKLQTAEERATAAEKNREEFEKTLRSEIERDQYITAHMNTIKWAVEGTRRSREINVLTKEANEKFDIAPDGSFTQKGKKTVVMRGDKGRYTNITEWIDDQVTELQLVKLSNGEDEIDISDKTKQTYLARAKDKEQATRQLREHYKQLEKIEDKWK